MTEREAAIERLVRARTAERQVRKALDLLARNVGHLPRVKRTVVSQERVSALLAELRFFTLGPENRG